MYHFNRQLGYQSTFLCSMQHNIYTLTVIYSENVGGLIPTLLVNNSAKKRIWELWLRIKKNGGSLKFNVLWKKLRKTLIYKSLWSYNEKHKLHKSLPIKFVCFLLMLLYVFCDINMYVLSYFYWTIFHCNICMVNMCLFTRYLWISNKVKFFHLYYIL